MGALLSLNSDQKWKQEKCKSTFSIAVNKFVEEEEERRKKKKKTTWTHERKETKMWQQLQLLVTATYDVPHLKTWHVIKTNIYIELSIFPTLPLADPLSILIWQFFFIAVQNWQRHCLLFFFIALQNWIPLSIKNEKEHLIVSTLEISMKKTVFFPLLITLKDVIVFLETHQVKVFPIMIKTK